MNSQKYDFVVIGGGIFGCYAALYLAGKGAKVALLEKEDRLFRKASLVNQARLHSGYHYPRSLATAALSDEHKERFTTEHRQFVHFSFEKYYAIDRFGSFTDPLQFERFCTRLNIPFQRIEQHNLFNFNRIEALYLTEEFSFDPVLLGHFYREKVETHPGIDVIKNVSLQTATAESDEWILAWAPAGAALPETNTIRTPTVINATYAASNAINQLFEVGNLALTHELSEIAFVTSPEFGDRGLTVMDGPFGSIMPYGKSGLLSLSSVAYTHHKISYEDTPQFDCQIPEDPSCRPYAPGICTDCPRRPVSNAAKMLAQMQQYFAESVRFEHFFSYYTIKSKLKSSYIDDGRPTEISMLRSTPRFYCLFSGKINSIYEVEKII